MIQADTAWSTAPLGSLIAPSKRKVDPTTVPNSPYLSLEHIESGTRRIVGTGTGSDVSSTKAVFRAGDVLYGKLRPYLNKVAKPAFDGICSTDILVFEESGSIDNGFLTYWLSQREVVDYAAHHMKGNSLPRVAFEDLAKLAISYPPIEEQRRIAAKLDDLLGRVAATRERLDRVPTILRRFRQSVLAAAVSGRLTADWRSANNGLISDVSLELDDAFRSLGVLERPGSWVPTTVGEVAELVQYGVSSKGDAPPDQGIAVLRMGNLQDAELDVSDLQYVPRNTRNIEGFRLKRGDVLFNRTNSPELVGKTAVFDLTGEYVFASYLIRIRTRASDARPGFLSIWLNSPVGREWAQFAKTDGVSQSNINGTKLRQMPILVPPMAEQIEIVRLVGSLTRVSQLVRSRVDASKSRARASSESILARAFSGGL